MTAPHNDSNAIGDNNRDGAAHTPGPWRSQGWVPTWAYIPVHDARHNLVASMYPDTSHGYSRDEVEANARLIAAAPAMVAAIRTTQCPRPANSVPEHITDWTVVDCVGCGDCGCDLGAALKATEPPHG